MQLSENIVPTIPCHECNAPQVITDNSIEKYLYSDHPTCSECNSKFDIWVATVKLLKMPKFFSRWAAALVGARQVNFPILMRQNTISKLELEYHGVPDNSNILSINYTPEGSDVFPVELHGNEPDRHTIAHHIELFGRPTSENREAENKINVYVNFIPHAGDNHALRNLALAFELFLKQDFESLIIPASVAVEDTLRRLIKDFLAQHNLPFNSRVPKQFLLTSFIPYISEANGIPKLGKHITDSMLDLWTLRNNMAHNGHLGESLGLDEITVNLSASIFCYHYLAMIRVRLIHDDAMPVNEV